MSRLTATLLSLLLFSTHGLAFEPEFQQQGMFYFHVSFDAGQSTKAKHHFGFRLDQGLVKPGETMTLTSLVNKPAAFDIQYDSTGLQAFKVHGVDYTEEVLIARGAEAGAEESPDEVAETEPAPEPVVTEATPVKKINIPLGVIIGGLIGLVAIAGSGS